MNFTTSYWVIKMIRRLLLILSILSICNYTYSFYTVMLDLPFLYKFQNVFTILMCLIFTFLLFASKNKEILALLSCYYSSMKIKNIAMGYSYSLLFCFIFISYTHYYISGILFKLAVDILSKVTSLNIYLAVDSTTYIFFFTNCLFFTLYSIPIIYVSFKLKLGVDTIANFRRK